MLSKIAIAFAVLLVVVVQSVSAALNNWDSATGMTNQDYIVVGITQGSSSAKLCYQNVGAAGNFYFEVNTAGTVATIYSCDNNLCSTNCVAKQTFRYNSTAVSADYNQSILFGSRTWNMGPTIYTANAGVIQKTRYSGSGCSDSKQIYSNWWPQSTTTCVAPFGQSTGAQIYCSGTVPTEKIFANNSCTGTPSSTGTSITNCDNTLNQNAACDSTTSYQVIMFKSLQASAFKNVFGSVIAVAAVIFVSALI